MKKVVLVIAVIVSLMIAEYRGIVHNLKPTMIDDGFLCIDLFGQVDWYDIKD